MFNIIFFNIDTSALIKLMIHINADNMVIKPKQLIISLQDAQYSKQMNTELTNNGSSTYNSPFGVWYYILLIQQNCF